MQDHSQLLLEKVKLYFLAKGWGGGVGLRIPSRYGLKYRNKRNPSNAVACNTDSAWSFIVVKVPTFLFLYTFYLTTACLKNITI